MLVSLRAFFSNGGYATWFQTLVVVLSVVVAIIAMRETDNNQSIANSTILAQKYFSEKPTLASASLRLRISQYVQVQEAKKTFQSYDSSHDTDFVALFERARPLVRKRINDSNDLQSDYQALNDFFSGLLVCVDAQVCDKATAVKLLGLELLGFYNAVCPYLEEQGINFGYDEDSERYLTFLVDYAHYNRPDFFCREKLAIHTSYKK
jgi:hypothetical protein